MECGADRRRIGINGSHLAEVFNIQIKSGLEICLVYGTIQVEDNQGTLTLYNRSSENVESVYESGSLSLNIGKDCRPIDASGSFKVIFDLKDNDGNEFIKNSFFVDANNIDSLPFSDHEKCLVAEVGGKLGGAIVTYAIYQIGVLACLLTHYVKENNGNDNDNDSRDSECEYVYGNLETVHYDDEFGVQEDTRVVLFHKSTAKEAEQLNKRDAYEIHLNRDFVVVPAYRSIRVEGDLHICLSGGLVESINISEQLSPCDDYAEVKELKGNYGYINLHLMWWNSFTYYIYRDGILNRPSRLFKN